MPEIYDHTLGHLHVTALSLPKENESSDCGCSRILPLTSDVPLAGPPTRVPFFLHEP